MLIKSFMSFHATWYDAKPKNGRPFTELITHCHSIIALRSFAGLSSQVPNSHGSCLHPFSLLRKQSGNSGLPRPSNLSPVIEFYMTSVNRVVCELQVPVAPVPIRLGSDWFNPDSWRKLYWLSCLGMAGHEAHWWPRTCEVWISS